MNLKWENDHSVEIAKWKYAKGESVLKSCETSPCELSPSKLGRTPYYIFHTWMLSHLCDSACEHCAVLQSWSTCYTVGRGRAWIHCALSRGSPSCKPHQRSLGRKNTWMALSPGACDCAAQNCPDNLVPYCTHHIWTPQLPSTLQTFVWSWSTHCYLAFSAILVGRVLSLVCQVFCFPILGTPSLETSLETQPPWNNLWYLSVRKLQQLEFRFYVTGKKQLVKLIPERKSDRQALNRPMVSLFQIISNLYLWRHGSWSSSLLGWTMRRRR